MSTQTLQSHAPTLEAARKDLQQKLTPGTVLIRETVLNDGSSKKVEAEGTTIEDATQKAKAMLPAKANIEKEDVVQQPTRETIQVAAFEESEARQAAAISRPKRIDSVSLTESGRKGFLGIGRRPSAYDIVITQPAVVTITYRELASIRAEVGTLLDKYEAEYVTMPSRQRVRILRKGAPREQETMLLAAARHEADDPLEFAAIDLLGCSAPAVSSAALQLIVKKDWISAAAWKIAFELRGRAMYLWELSENAKIMSSFAETPVLGVKRARSALEFVRRELVQETLRSTFEERFHTFTLENEPLVAASEAIRRLADLKLCRQCGEKMQMNPQGPYVQLRCEGCDITRFEKPGDL